MQLDVVVIKGKKVALGANDRIFRKEKVQQIIVGQAAKVAAATAKKTDVDADLAIAGISDTGKSVLQTIADKMEREIARGNAIGVAFSDIVDQLDPSATPGG